MLAVFHGVCLIYYDTLYITASLYFTSLVPVLNLINLTNSRLVLLLRDPAAERVLDNLILSTPVTQGFFLFIISITDIHHHPDDHGDQGGDIRPHDATPDPPHEAFSCGRPWPQPDGWDQVMIILIIVIASFFRSGIREVPRLIQATRKHSDS